MSNAFSIHFRHVETKISEAQYNESGVFYRIETKVRFFTDEAMTKLAVGEGFCIRLSTVGYELGWSPRKSLYSDSEGYMTSLDIPLPYSILIKRYNDLSRDDLDLIGPGPINGCGPAWFKKWNIHPPKDVFFDADCNHHDWGFLQGYNIRAWWRIDDIICAIIRKLECDWKFYYHMNRDIFRLTSAKKIIYSWVRATIYFILVITCGWFSFNWRGVHTYY